MWFIDADDTQSKLHNDLIMCLFWLTMRHRWCVVKRDDVFICFENEPRNVFRNDGCYSHLQSNLYSNPCITELFSALDVIVSHLKERDRSLTHWCNHIAFYYSVWLSFTQGLYGIYVEVLHSFTYAHWSQRIHVIHLYKCKFISVYSPVHQRSPDTLTSQHLSFCCCACQN